MRTASLPLCHALSVYVYMKECDYMCHLLQNGAENMKALCRLQCNPRVENKHSTGKQQQSMRLVSEIHFHMSKTKRTDLMQR